MNNFYTIQALKKYAEKEGIIRLGKGSDSEKWLVELGKPAALNLSNPGTAMVATLKTREDVYQFASEFAKCYKTVIVNQINEEQARLLKSSLERKGIPLEDIVTP